jgi:hypothetical protein
MSNIIYLLQKLQTMVSHDINPLFVNYLVCNFFYGSYMDERMELLIIFKLFILLKTTKKKKKKKKV